MGAFFEITPEMSDYYAIKNEYKAICEDGSSVQASTVQWDVRNGPRFWGFSASLPLPAFSRPQGRAMIPDMNTYQEFEIDYFQDEDGFFTAQVPAIPGCVASGKTLRQAFRNAVESIESCLEARRKAVL